MKTNFLKQLVITASFVIASSFIANAQIDLNGGLSFIFPKLNKVYEVDNKPTKYIASFPYWSFSGDFGVGEHMAIQTGFSFGNYSYDDNSAFVNKHFEMSSLGLIVGFKYYAFEFNKFHPYGQVQIQMQMLHHHEYDSYNGVNQGMTNTISNTSPRTYLAAYVGTRYDISSRFFAFGEVGIGWSALNVGLQYRVVK